MGEVHVGISLRATLPRPDRLVRLAQQVSAVELGAARRRPVERSQAEAWVAALRGNHSLQLVIPLSWPLVEGRLLAASAVAYSKEALWPLRRAGLLGAVLARFDDGFRLTRANRDHLLALRRAFAEFPVAAELPHPTWHTDEGIAVAIDHKIAFAAHGRATARLAVWREPASRIDREAVCRHARRLAPYVERLLILADDAIPARALSAAAAVRSGLADLDPLPAQPEFDFGQTAA